MTNARSDQELTRHRAPHATGPIRWARSIAIMLVCMFGVAALPVAPVSASGGPSDLRINQVQVVGTHNSYHLRPALSPLAALFTGWDVQSAPLDAQLERENVRKFELDVLFDPGTGRFSVSHIFVVDDRTTCAWLSDCLAILRESAERDPDRSTVFIQIEPKIGLDFFAPVVQHLDQLDTEIVNSLGRDRLITPDVVRNGAPTLRSGVTGGGWPTVDESRGKFLVFFDVSGDAGNPFTAAYSAGRPNLEGRAGFIPATSSSDDRAAVFVRNSPDDPTIPELVAQGFIVRTRADSEADRVAAFASGATMVSTDRPAIGHESPGSGTAVVALPGDRPARCNPVSAPIDCDDDSIEPATVRPDQQLSVTVLRPGSAPFNASSTLDGRPLGAGPTRAVDGPDRLVGTAEADGTTVTADVFRPFGLPFLLGELRIISPSAALDVTVPGIFARFTSKTRDGRDVYDFAGPALPTGSFPIPGGDAFVTLVD